MSKFCQIFIILSLLYFSRGKTRSLNNRIKRFDDLFHDISVDDSYINTSSRKGEQENGRENVNEESKQSVLKSKDMWKENSADASGTLVIEGLQNFKYYPKLKQKIDYPYFNSARRENLSGLWNSSKSTTPSSIEDTEDTEPDCIEITSNRPMLTSSQKPVSTINPSVAPISEFLDVRAEDCPEIMHDISFESVKDCMDRKSILKQLGHRYVQIMPPFPPVVNIYAPPMVNMFSAPILPPSMTLPISYPKYPWRRQATQEKYNNYVPNIKDLKNSSSFIINQKANKDTNNKY